MVAGNREFVRKHPVATKRAVRAILKAADLCGREPERAARLLVDKGYTNNYELHPPSAERDPLRQLAGVQPRGYGALLRPAPA